MEPARPQHLAIALVTALGLGLASADAGALAVRVNPDGEGQVLLYPYYTVNGGNDTYLSIVNTTQSSKALKLRFRESRNARAVLEFNVYLGAFDTWTAALFSLEDAGPANLTTIDTSCTAPLIRTNSSLPQLGNGNRYVPFRNFGYVATNADHGPADLARTREGSIEVIEMGNLRVGSGLTQVVEEVNHNGTPGNVPIGCDQVANNWLTPNGGWANNRMADINFPTGGLYGSAQIINVGKGALHAYDATAIDGFYGGTAPDGGLNFAPGAGRPTLADASDGSSTVKTQVNLSDGRGLGSSWIQGTADAVSAVLMKSEVHDDFEFDPAIGARTELVLSFPTKFAYTDTTDLPRAPFTDPYADDGSACETSNVRAIGRDQETTSPICSLSPPGTVPCDAKPRICNAVSVVVPLATGSAALTRSPIFGSGALDSGSGSATPWSIANSTHGSAAIAFPQGLPNNGHALISLNGDRYVGLPVIGFQSISYENANAQPGKLGNYSGSVPQRAATLILQGQ